MRILLINADKTPKSTPNLSIPTVLRKYGVVPGGDLSEKSVAQDLLLRLEAVAVPVNQSLSCRKQQSSCLPPLFPPSRGQAARVQLAAAKFLGTELSWHIWFLAQSTPRVRTTHDDIKDRGESLPTRTMILSACVG